MTYSSAVCVVRLQLQRPRRAQQVSPLTNAARTFPANALSSIRETRIFNILSKTRPNLQSTIFLKAFQWIANWELAPPFGATLPNECFAA